MSYNANIPQPTDTPAASQPQLLANFQGINTLINVNHVAFDDPDQGKHKWVSFPNQGSNPSTTATEVALFGAINADTSIAELNLRRPSDGDIIPFTAKNGTTAGWTVLPSGIMMKWQTLGATGAVTVNANSFGRAFTTLYTVQLTDQSTTPSSNTYVMGGVITGTTFDIYVSSRTSPGTPATANINWLVIGV